MLLRGENMIALLFVGFLQITFFSGRGQLSLYSSTSSQLDRIHLMDFFSDFKCDHGADLMKPVMAESARIDIEKIKPAVILHLEDMGMAAHQK